MIRTILFDLDGTIIDSEPLAFQAIVDAAVQWGVAVSADDASSVAGKKWEVAFELLFSRYPLPKDQAVPAILARYEQLLQTQVKAVPGVVDAIQDFALHFQLALVSGSHRRDVLWALRHLKIEQHFRCVLGAEDYPLSKPSPDGFLKAMQILNADPAETLVFEDSNAGIASARSAGARVAAIESTNYFHHDQSAAHAHIKDFGGVNAAWVHKTFP